MRGRGGVRTRGLLFRGSRFAVGGFFCMIGDVRWAFGWAG